ncbi:C1 family peptidase [Roseibium sp. FZY0029]|uniref:C1 family peptidase n=1 Tax=Roseibium sp. FZY0029 TaxID=3116647 RepID=UPI002EC605CD|nr:C1 family peptidase [Roseibium sp. FZY0029]
MLNARPDTPDFRDYVYQSSLIEIPAFKAPFQVPGRTTGDLLAVRNQLTEGSCTGQALATVIDMQNVKRRRQGAAVPWRVSSRMLYSSAQTFDEFPDDDLPGSSVRGAINGFWNRGVCSEDTMPYLPGLKNDTITIPVAKDARKVGLGAYFRLEHVLNDYHAALEETGAILVSAMVHDGWWPENVERHRGTIKLARQPELEGAHAFAIVGHTPEGFLILNSWGPDWGGYDLAAALKRHWRKNRKDFDKNAIEQALSVGGVHKGPMPGIALWTYEDWKTHVLDAWLLRLSAPTRLPSGTTGGYAVKSGREDRDRQQTVSVRENDVAGHIIHIRNGRLIDAGLYASSLDSIAETARHIAANREKKYDHVIFYAHGGLNTRDVALARAKAMIPVFKRNRIYPVFFVWRSSFSDTIGDILSSLAPRINERAGSALTEIRDILAERLIAPVGSALWHQMKENARDMFVSRTQSHTALLTLFDAAGQSAQPLKVHLAGHSAGSILLAYLICSIEQKQRCQIASTTLFAPACTRELLASHIMNYAEIRRGLQLINLPDHLERSADPSLPIYGKSILWLVSRAFEEQVQGKPVPLAGLEEQWPDGGAASPDRIVSNPANGHNSRSATHGGFDNDPVTMNYLLKRIIGRAPSNGHEFRLAEISEANGF